MQSDAPTDQCEPLVERRMVDIHPANRNSLSSSDKKPVKCMQFNTLADGLSGLRPDKGGFTCSPPESLLWANRGPRILEEIRRQDADIIGLEELDHYEDYMKPELEKDGFDSVFEAKPDSSSLEFGKSADGCAIFFRSARFEKVEHEILNYCTRKDMQSTEVVPQNQLAVIVTLKDRMNGGAVLTVVTTHLKATKSDKGEFIRQQQSIALMDHLEKKLSKSHPVIILCDLNGTPNGGEYASLAYPAIISHSLSLKSAYAALDADQKEPEYTTWKKRPGKESKHTIDYIFYSANCFYPVQILNIPQEQEIHECRLPSFQYPSDHFALAAVLQWL